LTCSRLRVTDSESDIHGYSDSIQDLQSHTGTGPCTGISSSNLKSSNQTGNYPTLVIVIKVGHHATLVCICFGIVGSE